MSVSEGERVLNKFTMHRKVQLERLDIVVPLPTQRYSFLREIPSFFSNRIGEKAVIETYRRFIMNILEVPLQHVSPATIIAF